MPDLDPLPPLGPVPPFSTDPDRFAHAARSARNRRAVRTSLPAAAVAAVAFAVLAGTGSGSSAGLKVADEPTAAPSPSASPSERPDDATPTAAPSPRHTAGPTGGQTDEPSADPTDASSAEPEPSATASPPAPSPQPGPGTTWEPATLDRVPYDSSVPCSANQSDSAAGWCLRSTVPASVASGASVRVAFAVCRTDGYGGQLSFPANSPEIHLGFSAGAQATGYAVDYSSYAGDGAHDVVVDAGTCAEWSADFAAVDEDGYPLDPGHYSGSWTDVGHPGNNALYGDGSRGAFAIDVT